MVVVIVFGPKHTSKCQLHISKMFLAGRLILQVYEYGHLLFVVNLKGPTYNNVYTVDVNIQSRKGISLAKADARVLFWMQRCKDTDKEGAIIEAAFTIKDKIHEVSVLVSWEKKKENGCRKSELMASFLIEAHAHLDFCIAEDKRNQSLFQREIYTHQCKWQRWDGWNPTAIIFNKQC